MTIFDKEIREEAEKRNAVKNLKLSFVAPCLLLLASLAAFTAMDSFVPGRNVIIYWLMMILIILLTALAAVIAILVLNKSFNAVKKSPDSKNYFAAGISMLALLIIVIEIVQVSNS
ncbi:MAG: hypothetical protein ABJB86_02695 [Bacteroidota bacterium]